MSELIRLIAAMSVVATWGFVLAFTCIKLGDD